MSRKGGRYIQGRGWAMRVSFCPHCGHHLWFHLLKRPADRGATVVVESAGGFHDGVPFCSARPADPGILEDGTTMADPFLDASVPVGSRQSNPDFPDERGFDDDEAPFPTQINLDLGDQG